MQVSGHDFKWCLKCSLDKDIKHEWVNPFDDGSTFVRGNRLKKTSFWYSLESSCHLLSDENQYARVLVIFQLLFCFKFFLAVTAMKGLKDYYGGCDL